MNTKEQVKAVLQSFIDEYQGKHGIWGLSIAAGPTEYDEYGKLRHSNKNEYRDWALHVYTKEESSREMLPEYYNGVRLMIFVENQ
jgi:hypothetical protein